VPFLDTKPNPAFHAGLYENHASGMKQTRAPPNDISGIASGMKPTRAPRSGVLWVARHEMPGKHTTTIIACRQVCAPIINKQKHFTMSQTYQQIYIHIVFSVAERAPMISPDWEHKLYSIFIKIIRDRGHKTICIGGMPDHVHILLSLNTSDSIAALVQTLKITTSKWIAEKRICKCRFKWQNGYGVFSYSDKDLPAVKEYIKNQKEHHKRMSFMDEYARTLQRRQIPINPHDTTFK
jgi:REP element-mobilizing transposase RayT